MGVNGSLTNAPHASSSSKLSPDLGAPASPVRSLAGACTAHALHDGLTDLIYVLLPVWQEQFALSYGALALLRGLYVGGLAAFQVPAGHLTYLLDARTILVLGTLLSAVGFALAGLSHGLVGLCIALTLAGTGGSTQHPLASAAVSRAYGSTARGPLGTYNFAGDLGKAILPPTASLLLTVSDQRLTLWLLAGLGVAAALMIRWIMPPVGAVPIETKTAQAGGTGDPHGFGLLLTIGVLDSATRMAFLLFLPFLLQAKGAALTIVGLALSLVFIGGALGKAACGWLGARFGVRDAMDEAHQQPPRDQVGLGGHHLLQKGAIGLISLGRLWVVPGDDIVRELAHPVCVTARCKELERANPDMAGGHTGEH